MQQRISNGCLIDEYNQQDNVEIICDNGVPLSCTLNQTNLENNNNKFYIMQALKTPNNYQLYIRYGRIGEKGKVLYENHYSDYSCVNAFINQFKTKTGNKWGEPFVIKKNKYFMSKIDNLEGVKQDLTMPHQDALPLESKLDKRIQYFLGLISDTTMMTQTLLSMDIDTKKMPLGKISKQQILLAQNVLKNISENIKNGQENIELSNEFYTYIPYACGRRKPPIIDDIDLVAKYNLLLEDLENMVIATQIINNNVSTNKIDSIYENLNTNITCLDKNSEMWLHITTYVKNTNGPTHKKNIEIIDIFEISRNGETEIYENYTKDINNKQLLFHGSRLSNFCSILQRGLILNPESLGVRIAGKMFGYGIYGANCNSKSRQYSDTSSSNGIGALLLCEFALGNQYKCYSSNSSLNKTMLKEQGYDSTHGVGKYTPNSHIIVNEVKIPNGTIKISDDSTDKCLLYDEFIIYDQRQLNIKYLILFNDL